MSFIIRCQGGHKRIQTYDSLEHEAEAIAFINRGGWKCTQCQTLLIAETYTEPTMITKIEYTCKAGHSQVITYSGMSREFVELAAKLTDGSSPLYVHPPGPESSIGKCGICGAQLTSRVLDGSSNNTSDDPQPPAEAAGT